MRLRPCGRHRRKATSDDVVRIGARCILGAMALLLAFWLGPVSLGGQSTYAIVSGNSMSPTYVAGDLVLARKAATYEPGDVVVYRVPDGEPGGGLPVVHRITGTRDGAFLTRGDHNPDIDPWRPTEDDVLGRTTAVVPHAGVVLLALRQPLFLATMAGLAAMLSVMWPGGFARRRPGMHRQGVAVVDLVASRSIKNLRAVPKSQTSGAQRAA